MKTKRRKMYIKRYISAQKQLKLFFFETTYLRLYGSEPEWHSHHMLVKRKLSHLCALRIKCLYTRIAFTSYCLVMFRTKVSYEHLGLDFSNLKLHSFYIDLKETILCALRIVCLYNRIWI